MNDDQTPNLDENSKENESDNSLDISDESHSEQTSEDKEDAKKKKNSTFSSITSGPIITNIILAGLFANFLIIYYNQYDETPKFSTLLMMIQVSCIVLFFLIRVAPSKVSMDPKDWIIAVAGTALPMLIFPASTPHEIAALLLLQFIGILISILAIISLNNSFGIVPAIREIKTKWLYGLIRHPIYFGYFLFITCMVLQNLTVMNVAVLFAIYAADIYRIIAEERILSEDPAYQSYKMRVKWRLLPFVW